MFITAGLAAVSAVASIFGSSAKNKALEAQQRARIAVYQGKEKLAEFSLRNNTQRANEIVRQQAGETHEAIRDISIAERKALGAETIRRGEGITAGVSVRRSVDDVIARGNKAKAATITKAEDQFRATQGAARNANARELSSLDNAYHNMAAGVEADQAAKSSGLEMLFGASMAALSGASAGASIGANLGDIFKSTPVSGAKPLDLF